MRDGSFNSSFTAKSWSVKADAVSIPILRNCKPLKKGDEVVVFNDDVEDEVTKQPAGKKRPAGKTQHASKQAKA